MIKEFKRITSFNNLLIKDNLSLLDTMVAINKNKFKTILVIDKNNKLIGSITDGDIRRAILKGINLNDTSLSLVYNQNCQRIVQGVDVGLEKSFHRNIKLLPEVNDHLEIVGVFGRSDSAESNFLSENNVTIIAEIGNNHQGSLELGKNLIDLAVDAGADIVKFQMRCLEDLYQEGHSNDLGAEYTLDLLNKFELPKNELFELFDYSKERGIIPLCTPFDIKSFEYLEAYGITGYKIASADLTNFPLIDKIINTGKHFILSTGMSDESEIESITRYIRERTNNFSLLHCNSTYPAPFNEINLSFMRRLKDYQPRFIGYSGHERGYEVPIAAVAMGAKVIEKHFTIDKGLEGNDHRVSLLPNEFKQMVTAIRNVETSLGKNTTRKISQAERINRENLAKSLFLTKSMEKGQNVGLVDCEVKSPGIGLSPLEFIEIEDKTLKKNKGKNEPLYKSDFEETENFHKEYKFNIKSGIPVRYHDLESLTKGKSYDLIEFHLSYSDLNLDFNQYVPESPQIDLVVHCPELFKGEHLLDLSSFDTQYRNQSIQFLKETIDVTNRLADKFSNFEKPKVIVNLGGWSTDNFLKNDEKQKRFDILIETLQKLDLSTIDLLPQTMPPFPWHFGGQRYHNLLVTQEDLISFLSSTKLNLCFDTSHTMLAASYYKFDLYETLEKIKDRVSHYHIVDAKGVYDEGLQIGEGEINFKRIFEIIPNSEKISFIPEIWQGHKNNGQGFRIAFKRLNAMINE